MIAFEIKKIFSRRSYRISLVLLVSIWLLVCYFAIGRVEYTDENGIRHTGIPAARFIAREKSAWEGTVTEEVLCRVIRENAAINASPEGRSQNITESNIAYARKLGFMDLRDMINRAFCRFRDYDYYRADSLTEADMSRFYEGRTQSLKTWLYSDEAKDRFSEAEKAFLLSRYEALETPYEYAAADGWQMFEESSSTIVMVTMLFASFYVCGIFAGETQTKADAIFFSTKLGRGAAIRAKVTAGFLITTAIYWSGILLSSLVILGSMGFGGGDCLIQLSFSGWKSIYDLNHGQLYLLIVFGGWIGNLAITALAMTICAKTRSATLAVTVPFLILFLPSFLGNMAGTQKILGLLPEQLLNMNVAVNLFNVYEVCGKVTGAVPILMTVYPVVYILLLPLMYGIYQRTQVN